jgi:hypothetical protein
MPPTVDPGDPLDAFESEDTLAEKLKSKTNRARGPPIPKLGFSIPEFCRAHGISVAFYYELRKENLTPDEMKVKNRRIISIEAAAKWRAERTAA